MILIRTAILSYTACASIIVENLFMAEKCHGPPEAIYVFNMLDITATTASQNNESWPLPFEWQISLMPVYECPAYYTLPIASDHCCYSWLDSENNLGYGSSSYAFLEESVDAIIPTSANGANYCWLQSTNSSSLHGYNELYVKIGTYEIRILCGVDGILSVSSSGICDSAGDEIYSLVQEIELLRSPSIGLVNATIIKMNGASLNYEWQAFLPDSMIYPTFVEPWEVICVILFALGLGLISSTIIYYIYGYFTKWNMK